ncbi:molecular chaperone [uncultured Ferrimonas sp.]|uniref:molecular chaperone n=1 Tax=uncultured Ferrimonas sp. TaxID=432640 RepID=UPI002613BCB0|nr:molecular chaperone [uncultured Ferrimonas sp.]
MTHIAGFDFGTSNCAVGVMQDGQPQLVQLPDHGNYMASTLYAPQPEMICGWLHQQLEHAGLGHDYKQARMAAVGPSLFALKEAKLDGYGDQLEFGQAALQHYLEDPADCYYVRSPKSFLGASGLPARQQIQFEDIAASMMWHIAQQVRNSGAGSMEKVVIGRPVNFQGVNAELSNQQAISILTNAAQFVGFKQVAFLYEPMAAGLAYQQQLQQEQQILVIDIGGGTSDVSMLTMGPGYLDSRDHQSLVQGFSGERIGGNDFDIALNYRGLMPALGLGKLLPGNRSMPIKPFLNAASINLLPAQTEFYSMDTMQLLTRCAREPGLAMLNGLITLSKERMTYRLSADAERAKIALSSSDSTQVELNYLLDNLDVQLSAQQFADASERLLKRIAELTDDVIRQAGHQPDGIFLTGGSANSPLLKHFLSSRYQAPLISGDNFGSVTTGLTLWANKIFS